MSYEKSESVRKPKCVKYVRHFNNHMCCACDSYSKLKMLVTSSLDNVPILIKQEIWKMYAVTWINERPPIENGHIFKVYFKAQLL